MKRWIVFVLTVLLAGTAFAAQPKHITSPVEAFGFEPGADRKLADWKELVAYFQKLGAESDRIHFEEVGKTTEGRPFIAVTISAPDTIAHLDRYKEIQRKLADPRITTPDEARKLVAEDKTVLVVTCNVHSTEIASSQSAADFAYKLATGDTPEIRNILQNVIVVLVPSLNPDGQQLVVDWYRKYLGTPYEGSGPVVLWHHYVGHDDNRDWSSFTQVETRLAVEKVINPWHPQILYDLHQQGENAARTGNGGTIVALNKASQVYAGKNSEPVSDAAASFDRKAFYIPGSILQVSVDTSNPIAFGSTPTVSIFYENGPVFHVSGDARSVASFTTDKPLLSGWILGGELLKGTSAIAEESQGKGRLVLFGFRPQYRAQSEVTYKFLFNALLYSSSTGATLNTASAAGGQ